MWICCYFLVIKLCLTFCDPMDYSPPGSSIHGIFQVRIVEVVSISFFRGSFWPMNRTSVSCFSGGVFTTEPSGKPKCKYICTLSHSVVSDSAIPWTITCQAPLSMGILQARILEWVAMPSSRGSSQPRDRTWHSCTARRLFTIWATRETQEYWSG